MPLFLPLPKLSQSIYPLKALLLLLPLASRAQGYAEGISLSYERLPLQLNAPEKPGFHADVYRASAIVPVAQAADSSHRFLVGASLEALRCAGNRPGFGAGS